MPAALPTTAVHPPRDTVLYDGQCRFCRSQMSRAGLTPRPSRGSRLPRASSRVAARRDGGDRSVRPGPGGRKRLAAPHAAAAAPLAAGGAVACARESAPLELALPADRPEPLSIRRHLRRRNLPAALTGRPAGGDQPSAESPTLPSSSLSRRVIVLACTPSSFAALAL